MSPRRLFNLLITLTVAAGLLSAPLAAPSIARSLHGATAGDMHQMDGDTHAMSMHALSGDLRSDGAMVDSMPCCPDEGKAAKDCDSCPLLALCAMSIAVPAPATFTALAAGEAGKTAFAFPDDLLIDGLSARPPDHPPRSIV